MIQVNELRIGNWVNLNKNGTSEYYQIDSGYDLYKLDESDCIDITPINLDESILLKCGYHKFNDANLWSDYGIPIDGFVKYQLMYLKRESVYSFPNPNGAVRLKYLHELQNLYFALTKTELTINL